MLKFLKAFTFGFVAIAASAVTSNNWSALAASTDASSTNASEVLSGCNPGESPTTEITEGCVRLFARYYIPYAVLVATVSNDPWDKQIRTKIGKPEVQDIFDKQFKATGGYKEDKKINIVNTAFEAVKQWERPKNKSGQKIGWTKEYLTCFHKDDAKCQNEAPSSFWAVFGPGSKPGAPGPAFQVWAKMDGDGFNNDFGGCSEVALIFPGTLGAKDWQNNFRVGYDFVGDSSYHQLYRNIDAIISDVSALPCYTLANSRYRRIVAAGTSLGAGLAQFAAFANNPDSPDRIQKVFAFNPSPETGITIVKKAHPDRLTQNLEKLEIDRVRVAGEDLSYWEQFLQKIGVTWRPNSFDPLDDTPCKPLVRDVRIPASSKSKDIHLIEPLTVLLVNAYLSSKENQWSPPAVPVSIGSEKNCETLYDISRQNEEEDRTKREEQLISQQTPPPPSTPLQTQNPNLGQRQGLFAPMYAQAADTGPRAHHLQPLTEVVTLDGRQVLFGHTGMATDWPARRQFNALAGSQLANRDRPQEYFATETAQAADMGVRQARHALAQTQLAGLDQRQRQVVSAAARLTRVTDLDPHRQFYALAPTLTVHLDRPQPLSVSAYVPAANLGARGATSAPTQSQLADRDTQRPTPIRPQVGASVSARGAR